MNAEMQLLADFAFSEALRRPVRYTTIFEPVCTFRMTTILIDDPNRRLYTPWITESVRIELPEGARTKLAVGDEVFWINDFRERPGHTPGVEVQYQHAVIASLAHGDKPIFIPQLGYFAYVG